MHLIIEKKEEEKKKKKLVQSFQISDFVLTIL